MGVRNLSGEPWHVEGMYRGEGDDRRYKGRCKYFSYDKEYCSYRYGRCMGSAHCDQYEECTEDELKQKLKERDALYRKNGKKNSSKHDLDDDVYWY